MLFRRKKHSSRKLGLIFELCMMLILAIFLNRVVRGELVTGMSDGQIIRLSSQYRMGAIFDREDEEIVSGTGDGSIKWADELTESAFSEIIGADISTTKNSPFTIAGQCSCLFGAEDDRFRLSDLVLLNKERVGGSVVLTIDKELQTYIVSLLQQKGFDHASVIVSDWSTGEISAIYGPALKNTYHPGSAIKPILAAAALSINPELENYMYNCVPGNHSFSTNEGWRQIKCIHNKYHGLMNMKDAIAQSCNGYFVSLLQQVPEEELEEELKKWGFDTVVSYDQLMYWDHSFIKEDSQGIDYLLAGIGQANAYITPAGLNFCTNALLNNGILKEPTLVLKKKGAPDQEWETLKIDRDYSICDETVAKEVVKMMLSVTEEGTGVSFALPGFAAKTGTAQKQNTDGSLSDLSTVWTTGGLTNPETPYSVTVCLDEVKEDVGSSCAGQLAKEILQYMTGGEENG